MTPASPYDHVVLVSLDTLRSDAIWSNPFKLWPEKYSVTGRFETPALDRLALEGMWFPNCVSAAPYTSASHAAIFSGQWPLRNGVYEVFNRKLRSPTIFSLAKQLGYRVTFKVDFPIVLGPYLGLNRDADRYIVESDEEYLEQFDRSQRTFDFVHFGSMQVPYGFHNLRYGGTSYREKLQQLEEESGISPTQGSAGDTIVETFRDPEDFEYMVRYKQVVESLYTAGNYDRLFSLYLEGVHHFVTTRFESFLTRLLDLLSGSSYLLVVFGDHGHEYDRESYGHHNSLSEGALRVPLILFGPEIESELISSRVRTIDIAPTLADLLDTREPSLDFDGESLGDALREGSGIASRQAFAQVWTTELSAYVDYQERLLQTGVATGVLPHVLYSEVVYENQLRLLRQHYHYTSDGGITGLTACTPVRDDLQHTHILHYPRSVLDEPARRRLAESLRVYAQKLPDSNEFAAAHSSSIHDELRAMGYQI